MKFGVVRFPGSCDDVDAQLAASRVGEAVLLWHADRGLQDVDAVVVPGGFSYGDYLRVGAIARFSPVMQGVIEFARDGGLVLGICNGFQILLEAGLLPGAMVRNRSLHFQCKWVHLKKERGDTAFTQFDKKILQLPIAHATGNYFIDPDGLTEIEANHQVLFRYCDENGTVSDGTNVNGSVGNIAGICNKEGNVLGMMPHPERAIDADLGGTDGALIWESLFESARAKI